MFFIGILQHIFQIILQLQSQQEPSCNLLDLDNFLTSFVEVNLHVVTRSVASVKTLNQNTGTVSFKYSLKPIDVYLQVEQMLFCRLFFGVIWDVQFHKFIEAPKPVAKGCILNPFLISYDEVIERQQCLDAVNQEVTVAGNAAHWVAEEGQMHDLW